MSGGEYEGKLCNEEFGPSQEIESSDSVLDRSGGGGGGILEALLLYEYKTARETH